MGVTAALIRTAPALGGSGVIFGMAAIVSVLVNLGSAAQRLRHPVWAGLRDGMTGSAAGHGAQPVWTGVLTVLMLGQLGA